MNSGYLEWLELLGNSERRRCWLLLKALECSPLDLAIDLARAADEFIAGAHPGRRIDGSIHSKTEVGALQRCETTHPVSEAPPSPDRPASQKRTALALSQEQREQLLRRLAQGARNGELANEFGISSRQVQGIRMGSARQIAGLRRTVDEQEQGSQPAPAVSVSIDEIVRYLRQQDDVVVPQEGGEFLVNARFRLPLEKLVTRANRMRARQGKPEFQMAQSSAERTAGAANGHPARADDGKLRKGHPIFWDESASAGPETAHGRT
jgi:DNA-binding CsgD family transcriptional regulator